MTKKQNREHRGGVDRREFLKVGGAGLGMLSMLPVSSWLGKANTAQGAPLIGQKRMAIINLYGGNDGLNTVIPTSLSRYYDRRPSIAIASGSALSLAGGPNGTNDLHLHPNLVNLQSLWNEGSVGIVQKVGYPSMNGSHFVSQDIWSYGLRNNGRSGWPARFADLYASSSTGVVGVGIGNRRDFVGSQQARPLVMKSASSFQFDRDNAYSRNHDLRREIMRDLVVDQRLDPLSETVRLATEQAIDLRDLIDQAESDYTSTTTFQNDTLSRRLRDLAIMIQGGFETTLYYTGFGGFDTHGDQLSRHGNLMTDLDDAIGAFATDMKAMGVWNDIAIVVISEFGRRVFENGSAGTDHGRANNMLVIGGAVNGGIYGPSLANSDLDGNNLEYEIDFRSVYKSVMEQHLGVDAGPIFPESLEKPNGPGSLF